MTYRVRFSAIDTKAPEWFAPVLWFESAPDLGQAVDNGFTHAAEYGFQIRSIAEVTSLAREG